jgi:citrate synthase
VPYEKVWGLLVDGTFDPACRPPSRTRCMPAPAIRASTCSRRSRCSPRVGLRQLIDISDEQARDQLARASVMALSFVAQSARGTGQPPVPQLEVDKGTTIPERFLIRWRGEANPDHAKAIDAYWISAASTA